MDYWIKNWVVSDFTKFIYCEIYSSYNKEKLSQTKQMPEYASGRNTLFRYSLEYTKGHFKGRFQVYNIIQLNREV